MTLKVNLMYLTLLFLPILGFSQVSTVENETNSSGISSETPVESNTKDSSSKSGDNAKSEEDLKRIQIKETHKGTKVTREDMVKGNVPADARIIEKSFFWGRNVFKSRHDGEVELYRGIQISDTEFSGAFLIYDCIEQHWGCVSLEDANKCREKRKEEISRFRSEYSCAFLKDFRTDEKCEIKQLELVSSSNPEVLCNNFNIIEE